MCDSQARASTRSKDRATTQDKTAQSSTVATSLFEVKLKSTSPRTNPLRAWAK